MPQAFTLSVCPLPETPHEPGLVLADTQVHTANLTVLATRNTLNSYSLGSLGTLGAVSLCGLLAYLLGDQLNSLRVEGSITCSTAQLEHIAAPWTLMANDIDILHSLRQSATTSRRCSAYTSSRAKTTTSDAAKDSIRTGTVAAIMYSTSVASRIAQLHFKVATRTVGRLSKTCGV